MTRPSFILTMAWRESRASGRRLLLLMGAVSVGVGALVAINSFTRNLRDSARDQAQSLLGADLVATSRGPFPEAALALLDSVACGATPCGSVALVTNFAGMAYVPRTDGVRLSQVSAVEPGYPFYGRIRTDPASAWDALASGANIVVDSSLLGALSATVGDTVVLGRTRFRISGAATDIPGNVGTRAAIGPRVFIAARWLDSTGLITAGSLVTRQAYLRLPPGTSPETVAGQIRDTLRADRITVRSVEEDRQDLQDALEQMGQYLGLVALVALLLGGLGVASAVHIFIRRKIDTIAVLRCLGADSRQLIGTYLVQAVAMGLAGSVLGAGMGLGLQLLLPRLFTGLIPVDVQVSVVWPAVLTGVGTGLWVSAMFALLPLLGIRRVSPLAVLRRDYEEEPRSRRDPLRWPMGLLLAASVAGLAALQVESLPSGLVFTAGIGVTLGLLALAAWGMVRGLRRWFPTGLPYLWRQGLANLYRPANQTTMVVLALGFGAFLLSTLYLVQNNLLARFQMDRTGARPNLVFWDIQPEQKDPLERMLRDSGYAPSSPVPIVPMRIASVKGRPVADLLKDTMRVDEHGERRGHWAFRREYRSTYRDSTVGSEKVVVGDWWATGGQTGGGRTGGPGRARLRRDGPCRRAGRHHRRHHRVGRAGRGVHHPGAEPANGQLGPVRTQLLRGLP